MERSDYIIFADESGNPNLKSVDPNYPVFVFCCCVFPRQHYDAAVAPAVAALKASHFGSPNVILRSHPIRRRLPPFDFPDHPHRRAAFMGDLTRLITAADFTVIAAAVELNQFQQRYPDASTVDYLAFRQCIIRLTDLLQSRGQHELATTIVIESRGQQDDNALSQEYQTLRQSALDSEQTPPNFELQFDPKGNNTAGVQIADLVAAPIGRHLASPQYQNRAWDIISAKLYQSPQGQTDEWGLIRLPDA